MEGLSVLESAQGTGKGQSLTTRPHLRRAADGGAGLGAAVQGRVPDNRVHPRTRGVPNTAMSRPIAGPRTVVSQLKIQVEG